MNGGSPGAASATLETLDGTFIEFFITPVMSVGLRILIAIATILLSAVSADAQWAVEPFEWTPATTELTVPMIGTASSLHSDTRAGVAHLADEDAAPAGFGRVFLGAGVGWAAGALVGGSLIGDPHASALIAGIGAGTGAHLANHGRGSFTLSSLTAIGGLLPAALLSAPMLMGETVETPAAIGAGLVFLGFQASFAAITQRSTSR